jgi:hypothetical protein
MDSLSLCATLAPAPPFEIIKIPSYGEEGRETLYRQCLSVRIKVFCNEQGFPEALEKDQ